jgi:phospholipid/cholesterol/gamma-HCH transport system substrate-binding protein
MKRSTFITWDQLKVGALITVGIAILGVAIIKLGDTVGLFAKRYTLVTFLPNANGLRVGGTVSVAGQLAGTIKQIDFLPPDGDTTRNLKLTLQVNKDLQGQIRADSRGKLRTNGLLGDRIFDINPGTPKYNALQEGDTIVMGESLDYEAIIAQAAGAVGDMVSLTHDLKKITGGVVGGEGTMGQLVTNRALYDELTTTLTRTNTMINRLQSPNGTVGRLIDDPAMYQNLTQMIASVDSLVRTVNSQNGTVGSLLRDTVLYSKLVGISTGADSLVRKLSSGNGLAAKMLNDQTLYDQLTKAVTDLNAILADVRRDPSRYTKGAVQVKVF